MPKAFFFRCISSLTELKIKTKVKSLVSRNKQPYKVIGTICLLPINYKYFTENINQYHPLLNGFTHNTKVVGDVWKCLMIRSFNRDDILVVCDGYNYPRYTAIIRK